MAKPDQASDGDVDVPVLLQAEGDTVEEVFNNCTVDVPERLKREVSDRKVPMFHPVICPSCCEGPDCVRKVTRKTNECLKCDTTYPIYD